MSESLCRRENDNRHRTGVSQDKLGMARSGKARLLRVASFEFFGCLFSGLDLFRSHLAEEPPMILRIQNLVEFSLHSESAFHFRLIAGTGSFQQDLAHLWNEFRVESPCHFVVAMPLHVVRTHHCRSMPRGPSEAE